MSVAPLVQTLAQAAVVQLTAAREEADTPVVATLEQLLRECGQAADLDELGDKRRSRLIEAAACAGSYLRFLQPPSGFRRIGALEEAPLVWSDGNEVFADVLHVRRRGAAIWTARTSGMPRRILVSGRERHGPQFVGVRVAVVAAPATSLLVTDPTGPPVPLASSPLWFHSPQRTAVELAAAAASEQVQP